MAVGRLLLPLFLLCWGGLAVAAARADGLERWLAEPRGDRYRTPDREELAQAERLFGRLFAGDLSKEAMGGWERLGFELRRSGGLAALAEGDGRREGRGLYLFRLKGGDGVAFQVPHRLQDPRGGEAVLKLMREGEYSAAAFDSVSSRHRPEADLGRAEESYHTAFARAFAKAFRNGRLIQVQGFARERLSGPVADVVLGDGTSRPGPRLAAISTCLSASLRGVVRVYPIEIQELGGTDDAVGAALRKAGYRGFRRLEVSALERDALLGSKAERQALSGCLRR